MPLLTDFCRNVNLKQLFKIKYKKFYYKIIKNYKIIHIEQKYIQEPKPRRTYFLINQL